jgi:hypothetical protein
LRRDRRGLATLREELEFIEGELGQERAARLMGTTARSWQRWYAGEAIAGIPRAFVRVLTLVSRKLDLDALARGRAELTAGARFKLEDEIRAEIEGGDEEEHGEHADTDE